jgi:hypothetical protein
VHVWVFISKVIAAELGACIWLEENCSPTNKLAKMVAWQVTYVYVYVCVHKFAFNPPELQPVGMSDPQ